MEINADSGFYRVKNEAAKILTEMSRYTHLELARYLWRIEAKIKKRKFLRLVAMQINAENGSDRVKIRRLKILA